MPINIQVHTLREMLELKKSYFITKEDFLKNGKRSKAFIAEKIIEKNKLRCVPLASPCSGLTHIFHIDHTEVVLINVNFEIAN